MTFDRQDRAFRGSRDFSTMMTRTKEDSALRRQAADALRRARKLPVGADRNDLRQLAIGLLWLDRHGAPPRVIARLNAIIGDGAGE